jgi:hypothetical protein
MKNKPLRDAPLVEAADRDEALRFVNNLQDAFAREEPENREHSSKDTWSDFLSASCKALAGA